MFRCCSTASIVGVTPTLCLVACRAATIYITLHRSASLPAAASTNLHDQGTCPNNDRNDFDYDSDNDEWNDKDLAAIGMTQSYNIKSAVPEVLPNSNPTMVSSIAS